MSDEQRFWALFLWASLFIVVCIAEQFDLVGFDILKIFGPAIAVGVYFMNRKNSNN